MVNVFISYQTEVVREEDKKSVNGFEPPTEKWEVM